MIDYTSDIEHCLKALHAGGIILYPTDTVWGLGCDATNEVAVKKLYDIKNRPSTKSCIVLVADERELMQYVATLDLAIFDFLDAQTTPTTVIYDHAIGLAENVIAEDGSVAIRIVKDEFCKSLIKRFRKPIVSTSANFTHKPTPSCFNEIDESLKQKVDYVVKYKNSDTSICSPSRIISLKNNEFTFIR